MASKTIDDMAAQDIAGVPWPGDEENRRHFATILMAKLREMDLVQNYCLLAQPGEIWDWIRSSYRVGV